METNVFLYFTFITLTRVFCKADLPCEQRQVEGDPDRVICVCNATYCDTIDRLDPPIDSYITYTTSKAGSRFLKGIGNITNAARDINSKSYGKVFQLYPNKRYQTIHGFGGAATDSACINWKALPDDAQGKFIESYFSKNGLEYSMLRVPIASSDFSTHFYYYNDNVKNDKYLTNFTYTREDKEYKLPLIKNAMQVSTEDISVVATVWSPPEWIKVLSNGSRSSRLKKEYYQTYADYFCKFIKLYERAGVQTWGVSTGNEPIDGNFVQISFGPQDTLGWSILEMKKWLKENFGPTIRNCNGQPIKILAMDDQRNMLPIWNVVVGDDEEISKYIDGYAIHAYLDKYTPGSIINVNLKDHPEKFVLATEFSTKASGGTGVTLGDWGEGEEYTETILDNLVNNYIGFIDWNLALDTNGGPNWSQSYIDAPIIVNSTSGEFYKQPTFYVLGHFSKFIPRGSQRIESVRHSPITYTPEENNIYSTPSHKDIYDHVAFITPKNTIVVIIANYYEAEKAALLIGSKQVTVLLEANSIVTVEFPYII